MLAKPVGQNRPGKPSPYDKDVCVVDVGHTCPLASERRRTVQLLRKHEMQYRRTDDAVHPLNSVKGNPRRSGFFRREAMGYLRFTCNHVSITSFSTAYEESGRAYNWLLKSRR